MVGDGRLVDEGVVCVRYDEDDGLMEKGMFEWKLVREFREWCLGEGCFNDWVEGGLGCGGIWWCGVEG